MRSLLRRVASTRTGHRLTRVAARTSGRPGRIGRIGEAADRLLAASMYDDSYYRSDPGGCRGGRSGYADYRRSTSNADALAVALTTWLDVDRVLDVGCAAGFFVEASRELGLDARGIDVSGAAFVLADPDVRPHLDVLDLTAGLDEPTRSRGLVTAFEVLEHLPPDAAPAATAELRRVAASYVVATIPSYGANASGPDGWFEGKVRDAVLDRYRDRGDPSGGPVPLTDLARDDDGRLVEGHQTIASYAWWTARFNEAGLVRCPDTELLLHHDLARYGLREFVCLYVFRRPEADEPVSPLRSSEEVAALEDRLGLLDHGAPVAHVDEAAADLAARGLSPRVGPG
ncbi:MAG: methyltransferase domain-containing protein [Actinomycetota bacterium]